MFENPLNKSIFYYWNLRFINYFCTKNAMTHIEDLEKSLESTRNKLINHNLYSNLNSKIGKNMSQILQTEMGHRQK